MVEEIHWAARIIALCWSALFTGYTPNAAPPNPGPPAAPRTAQASYQSCSQGVDCVAMEWVCGGWWAVSRAQQNATQQHVNQVARTRSCQAMPPSSPPPVACVHNTCVVEGSPAP